MEARSATQPAKVDSGKVSAAPAKEPQSIKPAPKVVAKTKKVAKTAKKSAPVSTAVKPTAAKSTAKKSTAKKSTAKKSTTAKPGTATKPATAQPEKSKTAPSSDPKPSKQQLARSQKTGELARRVIQTHLLSSIQYKAAVLADRDPEDLHQMRVGLRRLRTAIAVFAPVITRPESISDRRIAKMAKTLGAVRDLDVLQQWFQSYQKQADLSKSERKQLSKLQKQLIKRRKKAFDRVKKLLKGKQFDAFLPTMEPWLNVAFTGPLSDLPVQVLLPDLLLPLVSKLLLHPGWCAATEMKGDQLVPISGLAPEDLDQVIQRHGADLHDLRKRIKQMRYEAEMFEDCFGRTYGNRLKELKAMQTVLGDFQDQTVLSQFLTAELGPQWGKKLPSLAQHFQTQHGKWWQAWQPLQQEYLALDFRQKLRQTFMG